MAASFRHNRKRADEPFKGWQIRSISMLLQCIKVEILRISPFLFYALFLYSFTSDERVRSRTSSVVLLSQNCRRSNLRSLSGKYACRLASLDYQPTISALSMTFAFSAVRCALRQSLLGVFLLR